MRISFGARKVIVIGAVAAAGLLSLCAPTSVAAVNYNDTQGAKQFEAFVGKEGADFGQAKDPRQIAAEIIRAFLVLLGTLMLVYMVYAGYLIMTAGGDEDRVNKGKHIIKNTIIGLALILSAYAITRLVVRLTPAPQGSDTMPEGWNCTILEQAKVSPDILGENINAVVVEEYWSKFCDVEPQ